MITLGIDLGISKIAVAALEDSTLVDATAYQPTAEDSDKIMARGRVLHELGSWVYDYSLGVQPDAIFIEEIIVGNNTKYSLQLAQTFGSVLSALFVSSLVTGARVYLAGNKAWKKRLLGNGNANKDQIRAFIDESYSAYALLCDGDQDRYDACCVGLYGLDVVSAADQLKLG